MADLSQFFHDVDDSNIKASTGVPDPLPPGNYTLQVEGAEVSPTKDQTGVILKMTYGVASGPDEGRKVYAQFNIRNKNAQAQSIGISEFKALCLACNVDYELAKMDTDALNFIPFQVMLGMEKENINPATQQPYPPRNRVTKYIPAGQQAIAGTAPAPAATVAPAVAAAVVKPQAGTPWKGAGGAVPF